MFTVAVPDVTFAIFTERIGAPEAFVVIRPFTTILPVKPDAAQVTPLRVSALPRYWMR
jgi:hypothetical protein